MDCSTPGFPVLHCLQEFAQIHVHWVGDASQPYIHVCMFSHSVVSDSRDPMKGLYPARLCSWDSPGKNTGVGCHFLSHGIIPTPRLNPHLLHFQADSLPPHHQGSPSYTLLYLVISTIWVESGSWWWTGRPGVLRFTGLQRVGHDLAIELNIY